jgi:hypothetical protein
MPTILADHNVERHLDVLVSIWTSPEWYELWEWLDGRVCKFESVGLPITTPDSELWRFCQKHQMLLLTANRNADGPDSLEDVSRQSGDAGSLPILTPGDADRILFDRDYAEAVASRILDILAGLENLRGAHRLYVP